MRCLTALARQLALVVVVHISLLQRPTKPQLQKPLPTSAIAVPPGSAPPRDAAVLQPELVPVPILFAGVPFAHAPRCPAEPGSPPGNSSPARNFRVAIQPRPRLASLFHATRGPIAIQDRATGRPCPPHGERLSPTG